MSSKRTRAASADETRSKSQAKAKAKAKAKAAGKKSTASTGTATPKLDGPKKGRPSNAQKAKDIKDGEEILARKAKLSRKSAAYHRAKLEAKNQGLDEEAIKAAAKKVCWQVFISGI